MKELKRFQTLCERDVPLEIDRRILAAAAAAAAKSRFRRALRRWCLSVTVVAAAFLVGGTIVLFPGAGHVPEKTPAPVPNAELLAMSDWTGIEQEGFNLCFQLYAGRQEAAELADVQLTGGY